MAANLYWHLTSLLLLHSCTPGICMDQGIVGGRVSVPHSRPYMVYIRDLVQQVKCGGFLIKEDLVLTAAHCCKNVTLSKFMVYLGVNNTQSLPEGIAVKPFQHPQFSGSPGHDIMLLKLETPATLNKTVSIIGLPKHRGETSNNCMVLGWGWQSYDRESSSRVLKEVNVTLLDASQCRTPHTVCTDGLVGPSLGDSGGPLICGDVAAGIVSYFVAPLKHLTMYTEVSHYLQWIHDHF